MFFHNTVSVINKTKTAGAELCQVQAQAGSPADADLTTLKQLNSIFGL